MPPRVAGHISCALKLRIIVYILGLHRCHPPGVLHLRFRVTHCTRPFARRTLRRLLPLAPQRFRAADATLSPHAANAADATLATHAIHAADAIYAANSHHCAKSQYFQFYLHNTHNSV